VRHDVPDGFRGIARDDEAGVDSVSTEDRARGRE
jgi:hypothetical protein